VQSLGACRAYHLEHASDSNCCAQHTSLIYYCCSQADVQQLSRDINRLRQQIQRQKQHQRADWLPPHQKAVALAIYILGGHSAAVAAAYCAQHKRQQGHNWAQTVEDWYLSCSVEQLLAYEQPEKARDVRAKNAAQQWLAERTIAMWVQEQNYNKGVAPASSDLVNQYVATLGEGAAGAVATDARTARRFCQRFRSRWHIRMGVLKVREDMPEHTISQKVGLKLSRSARAKA
jgi:hypothetical protein